MGGVWGDICVMSKGVYGMCEGYVRCDSVQGMNRVRVCEECVREDEG